jgi:hypothetical protein
MHHDSMARRLTVVARVTFPRQVAAENAPPFDRRSRNKTPLRRGCRAGAVDSER